MAASETPKNFFCEIQYQDSIAQGQTSFADIPHEIVLEIFLQAIEEGNRNLSIQVLQSVCKNFRDQTNDKLFWKNLLIKDFGAEVVKSTSSENYKGAYIQKYKEWNKFLRSLPNSHLLLNSNQNPCILLYGHFLPQNLGPYIDSLDKSQLVDVFKKCKERNFIPFLEAILGSPRFCNPD